MILAILDEAVLMAVSDPCVSSYSCNLHFPKCNS